MRAAILVSALAFAASSIAQAVPEGIAPDEPVPSGCETTVDGNFTIGIMTVVPTKRSKRETAQEAAGSALECTLKDGVLKDPYGRIGSVVANFQFQFDGPPQAGAIYTGGFSVCKNNSLALGGSTIWYRCMSGEFGNLYSESIGEQCSEVRIVAHSEKPTPTPSSSSSSSTPSRTSTAASSSMSSSGSTDSASATITLLPGKDTSRNGTSSTNVITLSGTRTLSTTDQTEGPTASSTGSQGSAAPTRVPRKETFGAVVGLLGAALMF